MKIDFEKVYYDEGGNYLIFRSNPERFYLLRVMDFAGGLRFAGTIADTEKIENGSGVIAEYLITKEEFDLWDTDEQAFRAIVENLCKTAPSDRFLKVYYQRSPQSPPIPLQPIVGESLGTEPNLVEEMKGIFRLERNTDIAKFREYLNGKNEEEIYFVYSDRLRNIFPAIDFDGKMFFTEGERQAKALTEATKTFGNQYYKVSGEQAKEIIENCKRYGVYKILYIKADGEAFIMDRDELLETPTDNKWETYNSDIYNLLIRCIECSIVANPQVRANQMTLTSQLSQRIFKTTFLVGVSQASVKPEDTVWLSSGAEALYKENSFVFSGAENFSYANAPEEKFIIRMLINTKDNSYAIPVFTDMKEFNAMLGENGDIPLAVTLEEICTMKNSEVNTILLNPATLGFIFSDEAIDQLTEMSKKPPMVFEPQRPENQEIMIGDDDSEKETTINIPVVPQASSTESILNMVANQITREDSVRKEHNVTSDKVVSQEPSTPFTLHEQTEEKSENIPQKTPSVAEQTDTDKINSPKNKKKGGLFGLFGKKK